MKPHPEQASVFVRLLDFSRAGQHPTPCYNMSPGSCMTPAYADLMSTKWATNMHKHVTNQTYTQVGAGEVCLVGSRYSSRLALSLAKYASHCLPPDMCARNVK